MITEEIQELIIGHKVNKVDDIVLVKIGTNIKTAKICYMNNDIINPITEVEILDDNMNITIPEYDIIFNITNSSIIGITKSENIYENLNLLYILNGDETLYSDILGYCTISAINHSNNTMTLVSVIDNDNRITVLSNGKMFDTGECVVWPDKDNKNWVQFINEHKKSRLTKGSSYYFIKHLTAKSESKKDMYSDFDTMNFNNHNYFRTFDEAEFVRTQFLRLLDNRQLLESII